MQKLPCVDDCSFYMHSVQSHAIRCTIESLKDVLLEVPIKINDQGLKICTLDFSRTAVVFLKIEADKCETFHCPEPLTIGIGVAALFKLIKSASMNDMITLYVLKDSPEHLQIAIDCRERCMFIESKLHTLDLDDDSISIPRIDFGTIILFPSSEFQKNIRDLASIGDYVDITVENGTFAMTSVGDQASQKLVFSERPNGMSFQAKSDDVITGRFSLKYLSLFAKSASLSTYVELYVKKDIPLILKYPIGSVGRMQYMLSPKVEESIQ